MKQDAVRGPVRWWSPRCSSARTPTPPALLTQKPSASGPATSCFLPFLEACAAHAIISISAARIDEINILRATLEGMKRAVLEVASRAPQVDCVLVDGTQKIPQLALPCYPFPKADGRSRAVAAASILAKVTRDRYLSELDAKFPGYGFARHKGYGTAVHQEALRRLGPCPEHRRSFAPVRALLPAPAAGPAKTLRVEPLPKPSSAQLAPVQLLLLNFSKKGANDERG